MKKKLNIPFIISSIIFVCALIGFICYLFKTDKEEKALEKVAEKYSDKAEDLAESSEEGLRYYLIDGEAVQEGFKDLYISNSDVRAWVKIKDTPINYPVMYTPDDEEYYIHRGFDGNYSFGGCIFAGAGSDFDSPSDNIITYGHHMNNSSMYHDIDKYEDEEYYKKHKYITFNTIKQTGKYEVIAAFRTKIYPEDYEGFVYWKFINASNKEEFKEYVDNCKNLTPYNIPASAEFGDQLITLSTCAYHTYNGRFVVVAKRIEGKEIDYEKEPIKVIDTGK